MRNFRKRFIVWTWTMVYIITFLFGWSLAKGDWAVCLNLAAAVTLMLVTIHDAKQEKISVGSVRKIVEDLLEIAYQNWWSNADELRKMSPEEGRPLLVKFPDSDTIHIATYSVDDGRWTFNDGSFTERTCEQWMIVPPLKKIDHE